MNKIHVHFGKIVSFGKEKGVVRTNDGTLVNIASSTCRQAYDRHITEEHLPLKGGLPSGMDVVLMVNENCRPDDLWASKWTSKERFDSPKPAEPVRATWRKQERQRPHWNFAPSLQPRLQ